ncbi:MULTISPECIES: hypothetical protein [Sphingobacterium]|uniref:hypothetical protein n=1 Tax=Sphingobacterium TaxID=28453 RepID=UPI0028AAD2C5|nr:hypothetical protein [Sphingobacterium multivorum]
MSKPFTPERLTNIRRMRKARRLFKKLPLFAYTYMLQDIPDYTYEQFLDDLRIRRQGKKRKEKSYLSRYGRFGAMCQFIKLYEQTKDIAYARKAQDLRDNMTKPYRLLIRFKKLRRELYYSPLIPYSQIKELSENINRCKNLTEIEKVIADFDKYPHPY